MSTDAAARWVKQIEDTIGDSSKVREGLQDNEAIPLIDWGAAQAQRIVQRITAAGQPTPTEDQVGELAYSLVRLMTRITWVVVYRNKKDAAWLTRTFHTINELSQELFGPNAPLLTEQEIADWIAEHSKHTDGELIQNLLARLSPSAGPSLTDSPDLRKGSSSQGDENP